MNTQKFCTKCGKELLSGSKFCVNCGVETKKMTKIKNFYFLRNSIIIAICISLFLYIIIGLKQSFIDTKTYWENWFWLFVLSSFLLSFIIYNINKSINK